MHTHPHSLLLLHLELCRSWPTFFTVVSHDSTTITTAAHTHLAHYANTSPTQTRSYLEAGIFASTRSFNSSVSTLSCFAVKQSDLDFPFFKGCDTWFHWKHRQSCALNVIQKCDAIHAVRLKWIIHLHVTKTGVDKNTGLNETFILVCSICELYFSAVPHYPNALLRFWIFLIHRCHILEFAPRCANSYTLTFGLLSTTFGVRQKTRVQFTVILSYSVMQFSILHGLFYLM